MWTKPCQDRHSGYVCEIPDSTQEQPRHGGSDVGQLGDQECEGYHLSKPTICEKDVWLKKVLSEKLAELPDQDKW